MKKLTVVIIFICTSFIAFSQQSSTLTFYRTGTNKISPVFEKNLPYYFMEDSKVSPPGLRMLKVGRPITFFGGLMIVTGGFINTIANKNSYYDPYTGKTIVDSKAVWGPVLIIAGTGMVIPGAILWARGSKKYKTYLKSKTAITSIQFKGNGLSLNYRF